METNHVIRDTNWVPINQASWFRVIEFDRRVPLKELEPYLPKELSEKQIFTLKSSPANPFKYFLDVTSMKPRGES
jgi:hypothetical protein